MAILNANTSVGGLPVVTANATGVQLFEGPLADRPPAGNAGRLWWATDALVLSYDDGTDWLTPALSAGAGIAVTVSNSGTQTLSNTGVLSFAGRTGSVTPAAGDYAGLAVTWTPSQTFEAGLQVGGSSGTDPFLLAPNGMTANADRPYGALAQQYSGIGIQGHTNAGADSNPIFSVWTNDAAQYFTVNNGGKVATYHTVLDDGTGNLLPDKNVTINSGQIVTIGYDSGVAQGSAILIGNALSTTENTQIGTGGGTVAGVSGSLFGIAQAGVGWLLALDASGDLGVNGLLAAGGAVVSNGGTLQAGASSGTYWTLDYTGQVGGNAGGNLTLPGGLATGFNGGTGVAVGALPSGMAAMFAGNAPSGYTDWLLQLDMDGTLAFHVDTAGNAAAQGGLTATNAINSTSGQIQVAGAPIAQTIAASVPPNGSGGYPWSYSPALPAYNYGLSCTEEFGGTGTMYLTGATANSSSQATLYQSSSGNLDCWGIVVMFP